MIGSTEHAVSDDVAYRAELTRSRLQPRLEQVWQTRQIDPDKLREFILRLDAVAFIWKQLGTSCENLPEAHLLIQAFNRPLRRMTGKRKSWPYAACCSCTGLR
jgi:hypothetical protein